MMKALRVPEQLFTAIMWAVSLIFAAFLLGLGQLVIGDLPLATDTPELSDFVDPAASARIDSAAAALDRQSADLAPRAQVAARRTAAAAAEYDAAKQQYDNWISTRTATTDPAQDAEVLRRTRGLDALTAARRTAERAEEALQAEAQRIETARADNAQARAAIEQDAQAAYDAAIFRSEALVFGLRLLITLPLLVLAGWFVLRKRGSDYWPLMRGFALFALYAFFFELVPYLPSYGGYIRYIVGIVLTLIVGHYLVRWMRHYLATRAVAEKQAEIERKQSIRYEDALKKMAANVCPGCERTVATTGDVLADFCVHCGMNLFDHCGACNTRKLSFFRYCMQCGTPAAGSEAAT
jgi:multidrug efflux pump subunit AcrA (membrane-fusion protein)